MQQKKYIFRILNCYTIILRLHDTFFRFLLWQFVFTILFVGPSLFFNRTGNNKAKLIIFSSCFKSHHNLIVMNYQFVHRIFDEEVHNFIYKFCRVRFMFFHHQNLRISPKTNDEINKFLYKNISHQNFSTARISQV